MRKKLVIVCTSVALVLGFGACSKKQGDAADKSGGITLKEAQKKGPTKPDAAMREKMRAKTRQQTK